MGATGNVNLDELIPPDPSKMSKQAFFKGTDVPVESLFEHVRTSLDEFLKAHPSVTREELVWILMNFSHEIRPSTDPSHPRKSLFGCMAGSVKIIGDIVAPIDEEWDAMK